MEQICSNYNNHKWTRGSINGTTEVTNSSTHMTPLFRCVKVVFLYNAHTCRQTSIRSRDSDWL